MSNGDKRPVLIRGLHKSWVWKVRSGGKCSHCYSHGQFILDDSEQGWPASFWLWSAIDVKYGDPQYLCDRHFADGVTRLQDERDALRAEVASLKGRGGLTLKESIEAQIEARRIKKGPTSIIGKWPGDETDEEINEAMKED